ncbi:MAG: trimeric intracellular cation channel family protein [Desulfobacterales bacterium]|nr:trimeric intracellular cation channel family protein [Desulfobacterales bacterium]MDJ0874061.1 trimeric intracellular cation channel family protein [Desulfobacterales bacterium]
MPPNEPLGPGILAMMYFGDVVFAVSGALTAARHRMDIVGFVMIGTITGIGGGTIRDLLLDRTVWWTRNPTELILCMTAALITFFFIRKDLSGNRGLIWSDAMGLSAFAVVGSHIAMDKGVPLVVAVFMGALTATGGGVVRDVLTQTRPMITCGELYATAALAGASTYVLLNHFSLVPGFAALIAFLVAFSLRAAAVVFNIRMGPPGEFIRIGKDSGDDSKGEQ